VRAMAPELLASFPQELLFFHLLTSYSPMQNESCLAWAFFGGNLQFSGFQFAASGL